MPRPRSSILALHRVLPPLRQTSPAQAADAANPFSALLDTGETEPKDRPDPTPPRESAPHATGFVRNKPANNPTKSATKSTESRDPARGAQADGKAAAQDTKDTRESETSEATEAAPEDAAAEAALSVAEATNAIVDPQAVTPGIVAAVLPAPVAPVVPETFGETEDAVLTPADAAALSPADAALAAEAETEKPAVTKPAAPEQKGEEKIEKAQAQGAAQSADAKPAAEGKDQQDSKQDEKPAAQADAKDAKKAPDAEIRPEAPRAETAAPARAGAEHNLSLTAAGQPAHAPLQATAVIQNPAAAGNPIPVAGLAVEIAVQSRAGNNRFEIRLDPPELGRINVRLDMDNNGNVTSHLIVDRVETLDMLRRDAPQLERALEQAGLKTSENGLQFSLRDQSPQNQNQDQSNPRAARLVIPDVDIPESAQRQYGRLSGLGGGLDIRV